jgi:hypothetical protein
MNRLDTRRLCGEGWPCGCGRLSDDALNPGRQRFALGCQHPGERLVHLSPPARKGLACGTRGRPEGTPDRVRHEEPFRLLTTPSIPQPPVDRLLSVRCQLVQNDLHVSGVARRPRPQTARPGRWGHRASPLEVLTRRRQQSHGLDATDRKAAAWPRQPANATFILAKDADRTLLRGVGLPRNPRAFGLSSLGTMRLHRDGVFRVC